MQKRVEPLNKWQMTIAVSRCRLLCLGPDVKNFQVYFIHINFLRNQTIEPKSYTAMLLYLFFDSSLSTHKKNENRKKAQGTRTLAYIQDLY